MRHAASLAAVAAVLLISPQLAAAQLLGNLVVLGGGSTTSVVGQAAAVRASSPALPGGTASLADTGSLAGTADAREASQSAGSIASALTAEALHAATIGWPDQVASEASLASLALSVAGNSIGADFVMARALAVAGAAGSASSALDNLQINGTQVAVTGAANQIVPILGGRVVINEQSASPGGIAVNALRVIVDGVADVALGSATAAIH
jgi:hypothetical protein